ncbi:MAG: BofC C-terminal domain-containing protein [Eubacteriales bacterium]|nr:BofC C-terminal domain-containing protein [Eubacteriales bacterium]
MVNIRKIISGENNNIYDINNEIILSRDKDPVSVEAGQKIYYNSVINPAILYVVAEHNGVIGIFNGTHTKLIELLNVDVCMLPEIDRQYLADGIKIYSSSELLSVICDYTG